MSSGAASTGGVLNRLRFDYDGDDDERLIGRQGGDANKRWKQGSEKNAENPGRLDADVRFGGDEEREVVPGAFARLTEEAQDLVCSFLALSCPSYTWPQTFANLCLVSKHWLSSARRHLYRAPLTYLVPRWPAALLLLRTLTIRPDLARHVRDLTLLTFWTIALEGSKTQPQPEEVAFFLRRRQAAAFSWQITLLESCPLASEIKLGQTGKLMPKLLSAVEGSTVNLSDLCITGSNADLPQVTDLLTWLKSTRIRQLDYLCIESFKQGFRKIPNQILRDMRPLNPISVGNLILFELDLPFRLLSTLLLPINTSSLTSLNIDFRFHQAPLVGDFEHLMSLLPSSLASLALTNSSATGLPGPVYPSIPRFEDPRKPLVPFSPFGRFQLGCLRIRGFYGMTHTALASLLSSSSSLKKIDLYGTTWAADSGFHAIFEERRAIDILIQLTKLEALDLGWLPIISPNRYHTLDTTMSNRNVTCVYDTCLARCAVCGNFH